MLSDEEKKVIERIKELISKSKVIEDIEINKQVAFKDIEIFLNLIEKLNKIIKQQSYTNKKIRRTLKTVRKERNKQQKEIKELKEEQAKRQWVRIKENGEVEPLFYVSKDKIKAKKDKIKAKIEELKEVKWYYEISRVPKVGI